MTTPTTFTMPLANPPLALPDITLPLHGTATLRTVLNGWVRSVLRDFTSVPPNLLLPGTRVLYAKVLGLSQAMLKQDPRRFATILRQPTHVALLSTLGYQRHTDGNFAELNRLLRELCLLVLVELSLHDLLPPEGVVVPHEGAWPKLRSIGGNVVVTVSPAVDVIAFGNHRAIFRVAGRDTPLAWATPEVPENEAFSIERPYYEIVPGVTLAVTDNNPLSHFEAHPDKEGNQLDLGGHPAEEWVATLRAAFALVDKYLPTIGEEIRLVVRTIVPVGWHDQKHLSASYREVVGTIYMTLHPQLMTMTEALVHEYQHNKLNALLALDPLLHNGFSPLYTSPVRPDPRPLHGVVLAVHAFQPIAEMYAKMVADKHPLADAPHFHERFRNIIRAITAGADTVLANAKPTPTGDGLFHEMRVLDERFRDYEATHWQQPAEGAAPDLPVDE